jgi:hypothetical protein
MGGNSSHYCISNPFKVIVVQKKERPFVPVPFREVDFGIQKKLMFVY